jgi:hypothetical protein
MSLKKPVPTNPAKALEFAEPKAKAAEASGRVFFAPEGHRRLTINVTHEMHKKLRLLAVEQDTTVTDILTRLVAKELR